MCVHFIFSKDDKPHYQTDDIKKGLDTVITQLQEAKNKLENENDAVYLDIDKVSIYTRNYFKFFSQDKSLKL